MRYLKIVIALTFAVVSINCQRAAPPVTVSDQPISINDRPTRRSLEPSKPLTEMTWTDTADRVQKLSDLKGKAVILDFWATFCPPCREEIPHLNSLIAKYGSDNLHVVGLNVGGDEDRPKIPDFISSMKVQYPVAFPEDELSQFIFAERDDIPQTAVFDRNGRMITKIIGFSPQIQKQLDDAVEQAVKTN